METENLGGKMDQPMMVNFSIIIYMVLFVFATIRGGSIYMG